MNEEIFAAEEEESETSIFSEMPQKRASYDPCAIEIFIWITV